MIPAGRTIAMPNRTAKLTLIEPMIAADPVSTSEHYPRAFVMWGTLAFCLSVWAMLVYAVRHFV